MTPGVWTTNGLLANYPGWIDPNAGVTTQALGGLEAHDWLRGILPWWNPYAGVGLPLAAEGQTPAFLLPLVLLLGLPAGFLLLRIALMQIAGLASFALLRRLSLGPIPSLVGAALFQLSGYFAWTAHGAVAPVPFLPLLLLGLEQARETGWRPQWAITGGIALSLLAGFPEVAFLDGLFALAWAALRLAQARDGRLGYAWRIASSGLLGLMLAAPAIWPFVDGLRRSFAGPHAGPIATSWEPGNAAMQLLPYVLGGPMHGFVRLFRQTELWIRTDGYADALLVALR